MSIYHGIVIWANATRLFCPPDRLATGRVASSPVIPYPPSWCRYSSSFRPEEAGQSDSGYNGKAGHPSHLSHC